MPILVWWLENPPITLGPEAIPGAITCSIAHFRYLPMLTTFVRARRHPSTID